MCVFRIRDTLRGFALSTGCPMRVVQVSFHADRKRRTGEALLEVWPTIPAIADAVRRTGVELHVVQAAHRAETVDRNDVIYHFVDDMRGMPRRIVGPVRFRRRPTRIIDRVRALEPDVVHVHDFSNPLAIRQLTDAVRVPVLVQDHAVQPPRGWRQAAWRWALSGIAGAAFTARPQSMPFVRRGVFAPDLPVFEVMPMSSTFEPGDRDAARAKTGLHGDPCFIWTTHLDANKDPDTALAAFELAAQELPNARLWMAFLRAPLLDAVRERIRDSEILRARVTLLGARPHDHIQDLLRASDFFLQTSHVEASGQSLLDALACGVTPIVTDLAPWRRMIGDAGSLTPVGDARTLARTMVEWARRDRTELRQAARLRFERALTYETIGRDLSVIYETLKTLRRGEWAEQDYT